MIGLAHNLAAEKRAGDRRAKALVRAVIQFVRGGVDIMRPRRFE